MCFLLFCIPKCWPWHLLVLRKSVLCSLCLHTWVLWFKAFTYIGKVNMNYMKFTAKDRYLQFR